MGMQITTLSRFAPARHYAAAGVVVLEGCQVIELSLRGDFSRAERALQIVAHHQVPFAASRALNDVARAAQAAVNRAMPEVFDRPTSFTERAAVAPLSLAAQKDRLAATVTLRPIQAQYLLREEVGGTRTPADNTRRTGAQAIVLPGRGLLLDSHGNIPAGTLRQLKQDARPPSKRRRRKDGTARPSVATPAVVEGARSIVFLPKSAPGARGVGGYFARMAGHGLRRLTAFEGQTSYPAPRLGYHARMREVAGAEWLAAMRRRLAEAIATAR